MDTQSRTRTRSPGASRITNGRALFLPVDGERVDERSARSRRWRDVNQQLLAEAAASAPLTDARRALVRTATTLACQLEDLDAQFASGRDVTRDLLHLSAEFRAVLARLGLADRATLQDESALDWYCRLSNATNGGGNAEPQREPNARDRDRDRDADRDDEPKPAPIVRRRIKEDD